MSILDEHDQLMASVDRASASEPLTEHQRAVIGVVAHLRSSVDAAPITALMRDGGGARDRVREALEVLGELDPQLLVQVALDALVSAHADDRGAAPLRH